MIILNRILTPVCLVFVFLSYAVAQQRPLAPTAGDIAGMTCSEAVKQLKIKVEQSNQLGDSFLQINDALENVYQIWGNNLLKPMDDKELLKASSYFKQSAAEVKEARIKSAKVIQDLNIEINLLINHIGNCVGLSQKE